MGIVAPTFIGGVLRHGLEIPRSATLEYNSWEVSNVEDHGDERSHSTRCDFLERKLVRGGKVGLSK